jgi:beta-lactamase class A
MRERFPMLSTFKLLAVADVLGRVDAGLEQLDRRLVFQASDVVVNSLVTKDRVGGSGMTLAELCDAAMIFSDNTAGNLLLSTIGGPAGLTAYIRNSGDSETRLDRWEPALNEAIPDDPRDTTTPAAMLGHLSSIVFGTRLSPASRLRIQQWLIDNRTGATRLRAGIPPLWLAGDKTGTGERGTVNDIGVMWPPQRAPILACIYFTGSGADAAARNEVIAAAGRAIAKVYSA